VTQAFCPHGIDRFREDCSRCGPSALMRLDLTSGKPDSVLDRQMREIMRLHTKLRAIKAIAMSIDTRGQRNAVDAICTKVDEAFEPELES
jgi:hypothetical protein